MNRNEFEEKLGALGTNRARAIAEGWLPLTHAEFNAWGHPAFTPPRNLEVIISAIAQREKPTPLGKAVTSGRRSRRFACGCEWSVKRGMFSRCGQKHGPTPFG